MFDFNKFDVIVAQVNIFEFAFYVSAFELYKCMNAVLCEVVIC